MIVTAEKSTDTAIVPLHLALTCIFAPGISTQEAQRVTAQARPLWTVSSPWLQRPRVSYQMRVLHQPLRGFELSCAEARIDQPLKIPASRPH